MLNRILAFSLHNRLIVLIGAAFLTLIGAYTMRSMDVDIFPDLTAPTVTILTESHGMEAEEVEKQVTYQIETAMNGAPDVRRIRSSSAMGISIVWVEFEWGTEIYKARQIVSEKMIAVKEKLPSGVGEPSMAPVSSIMGEVMLISVTSDSINPMELRTLADWDIAPRLKSVSGVANVIVIGGEFKQFQVLVSPEKLDHYKVDLKEVVQAVQASSKNATGGYFNEHGNQYVIKGEGRISELQDLKNSVIKSVNGAVVRVEDVAYVKIGAGDKIGDGSMNGSPAVIMTLSKQPQTNTLDLTDDLDRAVKDLNGSLPKGVNLRTDIFRQSDFIQASVDNLQQTLMEGIIFVIIVLVIFLMNWRTTLISLLAIPLSLIVSFLVLNFLGYTINTMSLGGMAIAIGALVDDAIIDVENVFKHLRLNSKLPKEQRVNIIKVVLDASMEIRSSIIIATLIIIVSFVPLFFLSGMEGRLLQPLGIAFVTSVLTSLVVAITVTPILCTYLLNNDKVLTKQADGTKAERFLRKYYDRSLGTVLKHPKKLVYGTVGVFGISLIFAATLGRSFLPEFNEGSLVISVVGPPSMSIEESNKVGKMVENILLNMPEIGVVTRRTGRAESDEHAQGVNASEVDAPFVLKDRSKEEFLEAVRSNLSNVPGVNITIGMPIAHRIDHMLSGTRANIAIKVYGSDINRLFGICNQIKTQIEPIEGLVDVSVEQQIEVPQIRITPKRELLATHGMKIEEFTSFIDVAFAGEKVNEVYDGQKRFDMIVRYDTLSRGSIDKIKNALVNLPNGTMVALSEIADVRSVTTPHTINRENVQRKVVVSANVSGRDLRGAVNEIREGISANVKIPEGYYIEYGGQFESEEKASQLLIYASLAAIAIIFLLLYMEFNNLKLAGIVLLNLPLALIGGIFIVYFTSGIVSIASTIGFISLFGIATRNGILMISRYQHLKEEGQTGDEVLMTGSSDRLIPILMTALTTALALIPLAFNGDEPGNEIQSPMALVILGGLLTATLLNLYVIPCIYKMFRMHE